MGINFNKIEKKQKRFLVVLAVFLVSLLVTAIVNRQAGNLVVRIEGTGTKQEESFGTDIRIQRIERDNIQLYKQDVKIKGNWKESNGCFEALLADDSTWMEIVCRPSQRLLIQFTTQEGSGFVTIYENKSVCQTWNLYSPLQGTVSYETFNHQETKGWLTLIPWFLLAEGLLVEYLLLQLLLEKVRFDPKRRKLSNLLLLLLQACVLFAAVELIGFNLKNVTGSMLVWNVLLYFSLMLGAYGLIPVPCWVAGIMFVFFVGFSAVNYYVTRLRGSPIMPSDFLNIWTAASVASNYSFGLSKNIPVAAALALAGWMAGKRFTGKISWRMKERAGILALAAVLLLATVKAAANEKMNLWNLQENIQVKGFGFNLVSTTYHSRLKKPENYDPETAEQVLAQYTEEESSFTPNIIVIMNEAFSDLSTLCEDLDSNAYMRFYNELQENTVKGTVVSSVIGGLTSNSEYEFLTGNSIFFMRNHVPYQQHIYQDTYSLVGELKDRGYAAVAVHPYLASGYNRPKVYDYFGFDEFVTIEDFEDCDMIRGQYVSDMDSYEKVIEIFEQIQQTSDPAFIFNITMQNHGEYKTGYFGEDVLEIPGLEGRFPDAEEYLTLLQYSDEALAYLTAYFAEIEEPTVILLFGDHQPNLDASFYDTMLSGKDDWHPGQKKYEVPFVIWANYDIAEEQDVYGSLNYLAAILFDRAGISCTPYQNYLLDLHNTVPAISQNGHLAPSGEWLYDVTDPAISEKLEEYWRIAYYHMFDKPASAG